MSQSLFSIKKSCLGFQRRSWCLEEREARDTNSRPMAWIRQEHGSSIVIGLSMEGPGVPALSK